MLTDWFAEPDCFTNMHPQAAPTHSALKWKHIIAASDLLPTNIYLVTYLNGYIHVPYAHWHQYACQNLIKQYSDFYLF